MISSLLNNLLTYERHGVASIHKNSFFFACFAEKTQQVDHEVLQQKILEKLTVTEIVRKLRLLPRKSWRQRD